MIKAFNGYDGIRLLQNMHSICQYRNVNIKEYVRTINDNLNIYNICTGSSKEESKRHFNEIFFNGLGKYTKKRIIDNSLMYNYEETMKYLNNVERTIYMEDMGSLNEGDVLNMNDNNKLREGCCVEKNKKNNYDDNWCVNCRN